MDKQKLEKERLERVTKELEALFAEIATDATDIDVEESLRIVNFWSNKIDEDSKIDREDLSIRFTI